MASLTAYVLDAFSAGKMNEGGDLGDVSFFVPISYFFRARAQLVEFISKFAIYLHVYV